jgi:hypothetical protein
MLVNPSFPFFRKTKRSSPCPLALMDGETEASAWLTAADDDEFDEAFLGNLLPLFSEFPVQPVAIKI